MPNTTKNKSSSHPARMPKKEKPPFDTWTVIVFSLITGAMVYMATNNLLESPVRASLLAGGATLVSYAINRFAIEKGAPLAAKGFILAGAVSVLSIGAVGAGLFPSTFAGLTINDVRELQIHDYISDQTDFISARNGHATKASRLTSIIRVNEAELTQYSDCEQSESCLSGQGRSGRGPITKLLEEKARRASVISAQLAAGELTRNASLTKLNKLLDEFQVVFSQSDKTLKERRPAMMAIDTKINQELATLDEAIPVSLLEAYVGELETGVSIYNRPVVSKRITAILSKHAEGLKSVLASLKEDEQIQPQFPFPAGVSTTFSYIHHFLPIAALAACIELIFPLTLWVYVVLGLVWERHCQESISTAYRPKTNGASRNAVKTPVARRRVNSQNNHPSH